MKAMFGVVSLLVALAVAGLLATRQFKSVSTSSGPAAPALSGSGSVAQQSADLRKRVADDVAKAMEQGAQRRDENSQK